MINRDLFMLLHSPHVSEKSAVLTKKCNIVVLKVSKNASKNSIRDAIFKVFAVHVLNIRTLLVKGKVKRHGKIIGRCSDWKKAYVTLKKGDTVDFVCIKE